MSEGSGPRCRGGTMRETVPFLRWRTSPFGQGGEAEEVNPTSTTPSPKLKPAINPPLHECFLPHESRPEPKYEMSQLPTRQNGLEFVR